MARVFDVQAAAPGATVAASSGRWLQGFDSSGGHDTTTAPDRKSSSPVRDYDTATKESTDSEKARVDAAPKRRSGGSKDRSGPAKPLRSHRKRASAEALSRAAELAEADAQMHLEDCTQCSAWALLELAVASAGAVVLIVKGGGGDGAAFQCDVAAFALAASSSFAVFIALFVEALMPKRRAQVSTAAHWVWIAHCFRLLLQTNAVGLVSLALLAHATAAFSQLATTIAAAVWTVVVCGLLARAWRWGCDPPRSGELPAVEVLLGLPVRGFLAAWLILVAIGYGALCFKPQEELDLSAELEPHEHFLLMCVGSVVISGGLCMLPLSLLEAGRSLLVLRCGEAVPGVLEALPRAVLLSLIGHLVSAVFFATIFYGAVGALVLLMTWLLLWGSRRASPAGRRRGGGGRSKAQLEEDGDDDEVVLPTVPTSPTASVSARPINQKAQTLYTLDGDFYPSYRHPRKSSPCRRATTALVLLTFIGLFKIFASVGLFLFDVVFIQKYLADLGRPVCSEETESRRLAGLTGREAEGIHALGTDDDPEVAHAGTIPADGSPSRVLYGPTWWGDGWSDEEDTSLEHGPDTPNEIGFAAESLFGASARNTFDDIMRLLRRLADLGLDIPSGMEFQCAGIPRLLTAAMVTGTVGLLASVNALDLASFMSAGGEIAVVRAAASGSLPRYLAHVAGVQFIQQTAFLLLQVVISNSAKTRREFHGAADSECGYLVDSSMYLGAACPNFWHLPVHAFAWAFLCVGLVLMVCVVVLILAGSILGQAPARWAARAFFRKDLSLSRWGARTLPKVEVWPGASALIKPLMGLQVSFGVWTTASTRTFNCGVRQEWYEPLLLGTEDAGEAGGKPSLRTDIVSWRAMFQATARGVALAWLPIPVIGGPMCKVTQYLNENVLFSIGVDGGDSSAKPDILGSHFEEDVPHMVYTLGWILNAWALLMLLIIEADLLGGTAEERQDPLAGCLVLIFVLAVVHTVLDLGLQVRAFRRGRRLRVLCTQVVEQGHIGTIVAAPRSKGDVLRGLPEEDRKHVALACKDLLHLGWVVEKRLPAEQIAQLVCARVRRSMAFQRALEVSQAYDAGKEHVTESLVVATVVLLLHEAVSNEICAELARKAAQARLRYVLQQAAQARSQEVQEWARKQACESAAREATSRLALVKERPDLPRWVRVGFNATTEGVARVAASWKRSGRELVTPVEGEVTIAARGEVELVWAQGSAGPLGPGEAHVLSLKHQIMLKDHDDELEELDVDDDRAHGRGQANRGVREEPGFEGSLDWWEQEMRKQPFQFCGPLRGTAYTKHGQLEKEWLLQDIRGGVRWTWKVHDKDSPDDVSGSSDGAISKPKGRRLSGLGVGRLITCNTPTASVQLTNEEEPLDEANIQWNEFIAPDLTNALLDKRSRPRPEVPPVDEVRLRAVKAMDALEEALHESAKSTQTKELAAAFVATLHEGGHNLSEEEEARRKRLMAIAARLLRARSRTSISPQVSKSVPDLAQTASPRKPDIMETPRSEAAHELESVPLNSRKETDTGESKQEALGVLREVLARSPLDVDELATALEKARLADVEPMVLAKAEEQFLREIEKQRVALALVEAIDSRMIKQLRTRIKEAQEAGIGPGEYPDANGLCVIAKAKKALVDEERNSRTNLEEAMQQGGALKLQRALEQAQEIGLSDRGMMRAAEAKLRDIEERKRRIGLLKKGMESDNISLLKAAIEECRQPGLAQGISLEAALKRLHQLEQKELEERIWAMQMQEEAPAPVAPPGQEARAPAPPAPPSQMAQAWRTQAQGFYKPTTPAAAKRPEGPRYNEAQTQAMAALTAALYKEPVEIGMLKLAILQVRRTGLDNTELRQAEGLLREEENKELGLEGLKKAVAARDVRAISTAIKACTDKGVDRRKTLTALHELIAHQTKVAQMAGDHGLGSVILEAMEQERLQLHNDIQESYGGLRVICRIRPSKWSLPARPVVTRVDASMLALSYEGRQERMKFNKVFDANCIQAEVFNELRGLVQSAVDGYNVLIMACGPQSAGKTYTMLGEGSENRGVTMRTIDDLFRIRDHDSWRVDLDVDVQVIEVYDNKRIVDCLGKGRRKSGLGGLVMGPMGGFGGSNVVLEGAATRQVVNRQELRSIVEEAYRRPTNPDKPRHLMLLLSLSRINKATGAMKRSKLVLADLAGSGERASEDVKASYSALQAVFESLSRGSLRAPFREHMLTQVLQDCMGGTSKSALLLALSPDEEDAVESREAINFASVASW